MRPEEEEAAGTIVGILSRLAAEDMDTDSVMNAAQQQFKAASAATGAGNRRDINEMGYDKMQSIDMGVKHHDDHEGTWQSAKCLKQPNTLPKSLTIFKTAMSFQPGFRAK